MRAAIYDRDGSIVPQTLIRHDRLVSIGNDGIAEIDADEAFAQLISVIDDVLVRSKDIEGNITRIASCAFWHSLLAVDNGGRPIIKALTWADTRSRDQISFLRESLDESETHQRTGARFHSSYWPAKLLWLRNSSPKRFYYRLSAGINAQQTVPESARCNSCDIAFNIFGSRENIIDGR